MSNIEASKTNFMKYYVRFGLVLLLLYVIIAVIRAVFSTNSVTGVALILPFLAAQFVTEAFIKKQRRVPTDPEITRLSRACILVTVIVNIPLTLIGVLGGALDQSFDTTVLFVTALILVVMLVVNYFMFRWAFGGLAKKRADKLGIGRLEDEF
ncbi:MAG: ABZJ_00895 family protein [Pseudomonadota bacterium]